MKLTDDDMKKVKQVLDSLGLATTTDTALEKDGKPYFQLARGSASGKARERVRIFITRTRYEIYAGVKSFAFDVVYAYSVANYRYSSTECKAVFKDFYTFKACLQAIARLNTNDDTNIGSETDQAMDDGNVVAEGGTTSDIARADEIRKIYIKLDAKSRQILYATAKSLETRTFMREEGKIFDDFTPKQARELKIYSDGFKNGAKFDEAEN